MAGSWLMGLAFESGHVLAFRSVTASSIGPPYRSLWHRHPDGRWVIHTNVEPARACPRYLGPALHSWDVDDIEIAWSGNAELSIAATRSRLHLALRLTATPLTRALSAASRASRGMLWQNRYIATTAWRILRAGKPAFAGTAPSGYRFVMLPHALWHVQAAAAVIRGRDAGAVVSLAEQPRIGAFLIPTRGLFAAGHVDHVLPVYGTGDRAPAEGWP